MVQGSVWGRSASGIISLLTQVTQGRLTWCFHREALWRLRLSLTLVSVTLGRGHGWLKAFSCFTTSSSLFPRTEKESAPEAQSRSHHGEMTGG